MDVLELSLQYYPAAVSIYVTCTKGRQSEGLRTYSVKSYVICIFHFLSLNVCKGQHQSSAEHDGVSLLPMYAKIPTLSKSVCGLLLIVV